jgi:preprotein translocase subunit SecG
MNVVAVLFVLVSVVLTLLILVQKGRGGGLSAAFGGGMASGLLGSKTGDFLTWATITVVSVFLVLAVVLAKYYRPSVGGEYSAPQQSGQASQPAGKGSPAQPPARTSQPVPQEPTPAGQPSGTDTGAAAPQTQPPAPKPGAATTPAPESNGVGR